MPLALPRALSLVSSDGRRKLLAVDRYRDRPFRSRSRHRSPCPAHLPARWCADRRCCRLRRPGLPALFLPMRNAADWRPPRTAPRRACPWRSGIWCFSANSMQLGAAGEVPFPPRRDDLDVGLERIIAQLKTHLVVALAGGAMADRIGADLLGDLDLLLGDQGPRDRGAEQIDALIHRIGAEHREDIVADEFLAHILDEDVFRLDAQGLRLLARRLDLFALAQIGGEGDHLRAIFGLQPFQDDRRIQTARIGQNDFLHILRSHDLSYIRKAEIPAKPFC